MTTSPSNSNPMLASMWMHKSIDARNPPDHDNLEGCFSLIQLLETPSNRDRKLQSITVLNNSTKNDKTVKILLIIDIPPRILANVICPHLYI